MSNCSKIVNWSTNLVFELNLQFKRFLHSEEELKEVGRKYVKNSQKLSEFPFMKHPFCATGWGAAWNGVSDKLSRT